MVKTVTELRDRVIEKVVSMPDSALWRWASIEKAAEDCHLQDGSPSSLFPNGTIDAVAHFSDYIDRRMLSSLEDIPYQALRSKDRIRAAIMARLSILAPHQEAIRSSLAFWSIPCHVVQGHRVLWRTSDRIWNWAGDKATDYSRQTKRASLASIIVATEMVWVNDNSKDFMVTQAFLDRRLENTVEIGKTIGTIKNIVPNLLRQTQKK